MTDDHPSLRLVQHPLVLHKLTIARDKTTPAHRFRALLREISALMAYEVCDELPLRPRTVETPLETAEGHEVAVPLTIVPILRAGLGLTEGILDLHPEARVGHIGLFRDEETATPVTYYTKLPPDIGEGHVLLVDPMLATGGSAAAAIEILKQHGCRRIRMVCLVASPQGVAALAAEHPEVPVFAAALDRTLDERSYIRPGLGDAGDRLFGTV